MPKTNVRYWKQKIKRNRDRDKEVNKKLKKDGWTVLRFWEYDVKNNLGKCLRTILSKDIE